MRKVIRKFRTLEEAREYKEKLEQEFCTDVAMDSIDGAILGEDAQYRYRFECADPKKKTPYSYKYRYLDFDEMEDWLKDLDSALQKLHGRELLALALAVTPHNVACWSEDEVRETIRNKYWYHSVEYDGTKGYFRKHWAEIAPKYDKECEHRRRIAELENQYGEKAKGEWSGDCLGVFVTTQWWLYNQLKSEGWTTAWVGNGRFALRKPENNE